MNEYCKIAIVTISYKDLSGLRETASTVEAQSKAVSWYVVDGGSGDQTRDAIASFSCVKRWVSEPDNGIYDAMRKGLAMVDEEYVIFLNSGDTLYSSHVVAELIAEINKSPRCDVIYGCANIIYGTGTEGVLRKARDPRWSIYHSVPANQQATIYRTAAILSIFNSPEMLRYRVCGDYYLAAALHRQTSVAKRRSKIVICNFRTGGTSTYKTAQLAAEAESIQRDVLNIPFAFRWISRSIRNISMQRTLRRHENSVTSQ